MNHLPVLSCFAVSFVCAISAAGAQARPLPQLAPTGLLAEVLDYRGVVLGAPTPITTCSVVKLMETPKEFPWAFPMAVQSLFDRRVNPCERLEKVAIPYDTINGMTARDWSKIPPNLGCVSVDSVRRVDSLATVFISAITGGDALHTEEYMAVYHVSRKVWITKEAKLFGYINARGAECH